MHGFKPGQLFLYDKLRNVDLVLDHYIQEGYVPNHPPTHSTTHPPTHPPDRDTAAVLQRIARKENKKNMDLWLKVLTYVVESARPKDPSLPSSSEGKRRGKKESDSEEEEEEEESSEEEEEEEEEVWDDVVRVLQMVEREQVLPPHLVIDIMSKNEHIPLFVVRSYIARLLKEASVDVNASQAKIDSLRKSTTEKRAEVEDLRSTARLFQTTTCNSCRRPLELPAVHFLCMHSYHLDQACITQESECNECAADHHHYERIKLKDQRGKALEHELFFSELEEHGFAAVASYFGKGVLNVSAGAGEGRGGGR